MGIGRGKGEKRTIEAVKQAVFSPLLETSIEGASKVILNIMGSPDVTLDEIQEATQLVREVVQPGANIIFGADIRESMNEEIMVTIIATGFAEPQKSAPSQDYYARPAQPQRPAQPERSREEIRREILGFNPNNQEPPFARTAQPEPKPAVAEQPAQRPVSSGSRISVEDDFPEFLRRLNEKNKR